MPSVRNHSEGLRPSDSPTCFRLRAERYGETSPELRSRGLTREIVRLRPDAGLKQF